MILRPPEGVNLIGVDTGREHISHSSITQLLQCPQRYAYRYEQRLEPISRSTPQQLGKAFQKAIELGDATIASTWILDHETAWTAGEGVQRLINATIASSAADAYLSRYSAPRDTGAGVREYGYRVRLRSPWTGYYSRGFDLLGYADELLDHGDHFTLIENKLVGQITKVDIRKLPLDRQIALACYGVWRATGKPVTDVRYRHTRKPSIRQKQAETVEEFCKRVTDDYQERPDFYLHEEAWERGDDDLLRVEAELWTWADQLRALRRGHAWPRNSSVCADYGGCPFMGLCLGEPDAPSLYRTRDASEHRPSDTAFNGGSRDDTADTPAF